MKKDNFLNMAYRLRLLKRFSIREVITETSPAEHSWFVAMIALYVALKYNAASVTSPNDVPYNLVSLLSKAILHDVPEVITSDIVHFIKHFDNDMEEKVKQIEVSAVDDVLLRGMSSTPKAYLRSLILDAKDGSKEGQLISLCDIIEILYYMVEERNLGNKNQWVDEVFSGVVDLVIKSLAASDVTLNIIIRDIVNGLKSKFGTINLPENSDLIGLSYDKKASELEGQNNV